jgi:hypothetical protein
MQSSGHTMALMQRKKTNHNKKNVIPLSTSPIDNDRVKNGKSSSLVRLLLALCILIGVISAFSLSSDFDAFVDDGKNWIEFPSSNLKVAFDWRVMQVDGVDHKELGPHGVEIISGCANGKIYAYIDKDALVDVPLVEERPMHWVGTFSVPVKGSYDFKVQGYGCENDNQIDLTVQQFESYGSVEDSTVHKRKGQLVDDLISEGAWISSSKVQIDSTSDPKLPQYMWINPSVVQDQKQVKRIEGLDAFVVKEGSVTEKNGFFEFTKLSNYELVCFFGSDSAKDLIASFLSMRPTLFSHQRPFKFHYYEVFDFENPDATWTDETKSRFRKCKHVLVSIDEPKTPLSQIEYRSKMTTLIKHLTAAFNDETFPLWIFTTMEPQMNSKNCYSPIGKSSTEHPCNVVLKEIFVDGDSPFSNRVRLLDNTALTNPQIGGLGRQDILAAVALRIYIIVGYQVKEWRRNGQVGHVNGLTRGDKEHPNFDLVPYDWTSSVE